jgi:hypothetical protein
MPDVGVGGKAGARPLCRTFFDPTWTLGTMSRTPFRVPFRILLKICLFIDGIDEFEEDPTQLAELFLSLSSFPNIKLVIAGRQQRCFGALRRARGSVAGEGITPARLGRSPSSCEVGAARLTRQNVTGNGAQVLPPSSVDSLDSELWYRLGCRALLWLW